MRKRLYAAALLAATLVWAQGHQRRLGSGSANPAGNLNRIEVIEGTVTAVNVALGTEYPSITINQKLIKLAPAWFLLDQDFEIKTGDKLRVTAAPCNLPSDPYYYALTLTNASNVTLVLRDPSGIPQWTGGRGTQGNAGALRLGGGCLDPATITTVSGVVDRVTVGAGITHPTLVLKTQEGRLISINIGPEWILLAHDFEIRPGDTLTVKYAVATCSGENLALELVNAAGVKIVLRDFEGMPVRH